MFRPISTRKARTTALLASLLVATALTAACGDDDTPTAPEAPAPVAITDLFGTDEAPLTINPNGARTHNFTVQQTGSVSASLTALGAEVAVGLSLGTWNGAACQIIIANDNLTVGQAVTGTANGTGNFCVRIYDVGNLPSTVEYRISVTHF
jgi:hypothetical protein